MRKTPPLVPGLLPFDETVHIVLDDVGPRLGRAYVETADGKADESSIVTKIIVGEYSCPVRVVAFNTAAGWSRDVTEDIAWAVSHRVRRERCRLGTVAQEFLERTLGLNAPMPIDD
jgi:hypothetical protein